MSNNNRYGFLIKDFASFDKAKTQIALDLNEGSLGLLLGSGASIAISLPNWPKLVLSIANETFPTESHTYDENTTYDTDFLKELIGRIKRHYNDDLLKYFDIVRRHLYAGVSFDFKTAQKNLLIAIAALTTGQKRGTVKDIVTLNFDSVLEWYLTTLGLDVNVLSTKLLFHKRSDVNITHIHGFLPHDIKKWPTSDFLIFSKKEFMDRVFSNTDYWKGHLTEFFRRHTFLSIGVSPESLENDICVYLRDLDNWYQSQKLTREKPYGYAFLHRQKVTSTQVTELSDTGIVPILYENHDDVPEMIFEIAQIASSKI